MQYISMEDKHNAGVSCHRVLQRVSYLWSLVLHLTDFAVHAKHRLIKMCNSFRSSKDVPAVKILNPYCIAGICKWESWWRRIICETLRWSSNGTSGCSVIWQKYGSLCRKDWSNQCPVPQQIQQHGKLTRISLQHNYLILFSWMLNVSFVQILGKE